MEKELDKRGPALFTEPIRDTAISIRGQREGPRGEPHHMQGYTNRQVYSAGNGVVNVRYLIGREDQSPLVVTLVYDHGGGARKSFSRTETGPTSSHVNVLRR